MRYRVTRVVRSIIETDEAPTEREALDEALSKFDFNMYHDKDVSYIVEKIGA